MPDGSGGTEPRRATRFGRDVAWVVVLKVGLIAALYLFLFRSAPHPAQDPAATAAAVAGASTTTVGEVIR